MKLSSRTTLLFPLVLLLAPSIYCISFTFHLDRYLNYTYGYYLLFILGAVVTSIFYFLFKKYADVFSKYTYLKYALLLFPILPYIIAQNDHDSIFFVIFAGLFLFLSYIVFTNRYTAVLTDTSIQYKNLLGQSGEINLMDIVKIEQKQNVLSVFRYFNILNVARKTGIAFVDENLDEYEINIFAKVFRENLIFSSIIENATKCGNLKIRQYTV